MFKRRRPEDEPEQQTPAQVKPNSADNGLGVPPRPPATNLGNFTAPAKDLPMSRPPFATPTPSPMPASGSAGGNPPMPASAPPRPAAPPNPPASRTGPERPAPAPERRTLVVGRGISVQGMVQDAERLVVEGTVEANMIHAAELSVSLGGIFKGEVEVDMAEVAGTIDGTLTARNNLVVRATGVVLGTARCRKLQVEEGGQITGRIEMITEGARSQPAQVRPSAPSAAKPEPSARLDGVAEAPRPAPTYEA